MTADPFAAAATGPAGGLRQRLRSPDTALGLAGAVLLPLGLLVILLGWYGASHTPYLFEQVPYLISGGLIGLGLVVGGGLAYFASWVARSSASQERASQEIVDLLREIRTELADRPVVPATPQRKSAANGHGAGGLVATAGGSMLHRPDCSVVAGRSDLRQVTTRSGLGSCGMCDPLSSSVRA